MSALKPANKKRIINPIKKTMEPVVQKVVNCTEEKEKPHLIGTPQENVSLSQTTTTSRPQHPKGHKVRKLDEVWKLMDSQSYLRLTDTIMLSDVWVQPLKVEADDGRTVSVEMIQLVDAPHIKMRETKTKMTVDDVLKMLYICDCICWSMKGMDRVSYEDWENFKASECAKVYECEGGVDMVQLCNFIINTDNDFSFYPEAYKCNCGIFLRKICYHSYKTTNTKKDEEKMVNSSMMKCCSSRGNFEYVLQGRIFILPDGFISKTSVQKYSERHPEVKSEMGLDAENEFPESQDPNAVF